VPFRERNNLRSSSQLGLTSGVRFFGSDNGKAMLAVLGEMRDGFLAVDNSRPIVDPADPSLEKRAVSVLHAHLEGIWPPLSRER